ncbi:MAG: FAD-binding protein [Anaerolineae bacterium]|nr:FAD-binding protein [Anaerolineae bacterium]
MGKVSNIVKFLAVLILGSLAGIIGTLLLAPRSGKETRREIKQKGQELVHKIRSARETAADPHLKKISNWGNYPQVQVKFHEFEDIETLRRLVKQSDDVIARGNGRCYGDSALAPQIISSLRYNKFLAFDRDKGVIRCQSGVLLSEILDVIVPQGWFFPVTPGTKLITVGGAIASDVHGKSQHKAGNFSDHLIDMEIMVGDGSIMRCSHTENTELFLTTCGGMGLTGVILNATMRLIPIETAYIRQESIKIHNFDHMMDVFEESEDWNYSLAWIDCLAQGKQLGRGYLMRGEHAKVEELATAKQRQHPLVPKKRPKLNVPFNFPSFTLNNLTITAFNTALYLKHPNDVVKSIVDYDTFFYPLDTVLNWNRIYGKRGFTQYQLILPKSVSREGMHRILNRIAQNRHVPFVAVLKLYRQQNGYLPFGIEGFSLALDFSIKPGLFEFLDELDQIVLEYGGRLYLTKDVRMNKSMFTQSYPNVERFINNVRDLNHGHKFKSFQSDRVGITQ